MKRSEMIGFIEDTITYFSNRVRPFTVEDIAKEILKEVEKRGMVPVTERAGFSGTAIVRKWEEDITDADWDRAFDNLRDN